MWWLPAAIAVALTGAAAGSSAGHPDPRFIDVEKASIPRPPALDSMPDMPRGVQNLEVILIPHSHDDTGWQRNVDQYYEEEVRYIYNTVVESLVKSPQRKFIFVETAYFYRWWVEQSAVTQDQVRGLIAAGQIEFVNGGWCMADDASPSTDAWIDQVTLGHRYIHDVLNGTVPKYGWHIDPFGISASLAMFFKQMNYSGWVFNRIDTRLKDLWHNESHLEFMWKPAGSPSGPLFAHVLDTHYGAPEITYQGTHYHFDFEVFNGLGGGSEPGAQFPVSDRDPSPFYNHTSEQLAEAFVALARLRAGWYRLGPPWQTVPAGTGVILVPFGDDMKFQNAEKQYVNMDILIRAINANASNGVTVRYGTIGDYMKNVNMSADWPTFDGDFMPLGTNNNIYTSQVTDPTVSEYWTGHYTTRPLMKGLVARANGAKHTSEIAATLHCAAHPTDAALCGASPNADVLLARKVTSVLQHHDNIPGTSSPDAAVNLDVRLRASLEASDRVMRAAVAQPADATGTADAALAGRRNTTAPHGGPLAPGANVDVTLFNSLAQAREEFVELELAGPVAVTVTVTDASGGAVPSAVVPALPVATVRLNASFPMATDSAWAVFKATLPPLTTVVYKVAVRSATAAADGMQASASTAAAAAWACSVPSKGQPDATINGDSVAVTFSGPTGRMKGIAGPAQVAVSQQFVQWHSTISGNPNSNAYQFAPNRTLFPFGEPLDDVTVAARTCVLKTPLLERVVQEYAVTLPPDGPDCRTEASCKATCGASGHFQTGCGTYYCCNAKSWQCSGVKACGKLHDCACLNPNATRPPTRMLHETVTVFKGLSSPHAPDAAAVRTTTEFAMVQHKDRELVTRYLTDVDSLEPVAYPFDPKNVSSLPVFETDSNGALMLRRVANRTQWAPTRHDADYFPVSDPIAGNYYPLASPGAIRIAGTDGRAFAVVTDRAHGATSLGSGWVEVMMGRRCAETGGITVDDTDHVVATNWIVVSKAAADVARQHRARAMLAAAPLVPVVTPSAGGAAAGGAAAAAGTTATAAAAAETEAKGVSAPPPPSLPANVHLMSLDRVGLEMSDGDKAARVLLRVRHVFQPGEHPTLSQQATVNVATLLPAPLSLVGVVELPLNGVGEPAAVPDLTKVTLQPMETRTFEVTIKA